MTRRFDEAEEFIAPLYFVAFLLVATPMMDFASSVLPLRPETIQWRFATVGLLSGFVMTPLLGIILAMLVASWAGQWRMQRAIAIVNLLLAGLLAVVLVLFVLDIVQLRSVVQAEARKAFESAATKALLKHVAFVVALGWLGVRGLRVSRRTAREPRRSPAPAVIG